MSRKRPHSDSSDEEEESNEASGDRNTDNGSSVTEEDPEVCQQIVNAPSIPYFYSIESP